MRQTSLDSLCRGQARGARRGGGWRPPPEVRPPPPTAPTRSGAARPAPTALWTKRSLSSWLYRYKVFRFEENYMQFHHVSDGNVHGYIKNIFFLSVRLLFRVEGRISLIVICCFYFCPHNL
jgi:hypothetical protein